MMSHSKKPNTAFEHLHDIEYRKISALTLYKNNPRTHSKKQIQQISKSIKEFGFTNPILIDSKNQVIAGHGRIEAAKNLGMEQVPTLQLSHMTQAQKHAYIIADNKLAENAGWDTELLASELKYINDLDIDFDLSVLGFETPELDILLGHSEETPEVIDKIPDLTGSIVSKLGDLWILGKHRLLCANALDASAYEQVLKNEKAQLVFTDPPYNVPINGHVCGKGSIKHEEFPMASGEMSVQEFTGFLKLTFKNLILHTKDGSIHYICMDWRHIKELLTAGEEYTELKNLCVWNKTNGGMGSFYRSKYEFVCVFKNGKQAHINNIDLGKHGRYRTNVWDYPGVNTFSENRMNDLAMHPTVKPVALIKDAILDSSHKNDIILDCFGGSGSTLLAAEKAKRRACLIELDPKYIDITIERFQKETGQDAMHAQSRRSYNFLKQQKGNKNAE
jgi:DNA modification methylase